ncbi:SUMF1/EgtB/PvdO family nonheme iron enzyme [filamentous cyanobacterium LEGE 11480]|uniref:SUMF1/EgtB/PvdO family nonheme iron enzyme n=1 Tax=Romeriopsis navalis LEGE 11480 TaxID=2777977 RepID=A0A928VNL8_9CYAN|nr:SUMF1/EgtB/PvdO family nonheme iron enzyme [Romeriopsis navalis]MBE9031836.1 SUMF1/EgtB/PvdO family nonheme iron enzyme [Romeriopsis navalis LEGE 11480]
MSEDSQTRRLNAVRPNRPTNYDSIDRWAIIVGISQYQYPQINLKYADRDAEALYKMLLSPTGGSFQADHICKLTNTEATTGNITNALRSFLKKPDRDDLVIIYFACHGAPDPDRPSNIYLITHDTDPRNIAGTALPMREISLNVHETLLADKVVMLADTCHSAGIAQSGGRRSLADQSGSINQYLQEMSHANAGLALLTSAEANEVSFEDQRWGDGHGVFTHYLLQGMQGAADRVSNGIVTLGELFEYVRENVKRDTDYKQHPLIGSDIFDRDLPISIVNYQAAPAVPTPATVPAPTPAAAPAPQPSSQPAASTSQAAPFTALPTRQVNLGNGVSIELIEIPAGSFMMGSPKTEPKHLPTEAPQHSVSVSSFYISTTLITQAQWQQVAGWPTIDETLNPLPSRFTGDNLPIEQISWFEAIEFCQRLSQHTGITYRLPSEAEWEYACRGGSISPFSYGQMLAPDQANYDYRKAETDGQSELPEWRKCTTPVGQFPANEFGLSDMHGNVAEWCQDGWHSSYRGAPIDGAAWAAQTDEGRIIRGGSWFDPPKKCRSAYRTSAFPGVRKHTIGFRVVGLL